MVIGGGLVLLIAVAVVAIMLSRRDQQVPPARPASAQVRGCLTG
jgi:hypothetical protein